MSIVRLALMICGGGGGGGGGGGAGGGGDGVNGSVILGFDGNWTLSPYGSSTGGKGATVLLVLPPAPLLGGTVPPPPAVLPVLPAGEGGLLVTSSS